jgi:hypothetical protein
MDDVVLATDRPAGRGLAARSATSSPALERLSGGALALLLAIVTLRLGGAIVARDATHGEWLPGVRDEAALGTAVYAGIVVLSVWAVVIAPLLAILAMPRLQRRWRVRRAGAAWRLLLVAVASAAVPVLYAAVLELYGDALHSDVHLAAWFVAAMAFANPLIVFAVGHPRGGGRLVRIVVLLLALASLVHLAYTIFPN